MSYKSILIIDDEKSILSTLSAALKDEGYDVSTAASGEQGLVAIAEAAKQTSRPDIVLLDIWMPGIDGLTTLQKIKADFPDQIVIMMSGHGNIETAVKAVKTGAFDFIEKPLSLERLLVLIQNATGVQDLVRENIALRKQTGQTTRTLIGESPVIKQIRELVKRVAPSTGSVLITGDNGTGKEVLAQSIHALSPRFGKPFVEVNCAAIPEELIESELFGHEKGSFTGATQLRRGKFDLAHGGTLFLDEIGDMSLKTQAKILRILQEQKFERVGGAQTIQVDVRVIAATNKDLKTEIAAGRFREDLYFRLNVIPFHMPKLMDRKQDIPLMAEHLMREYCQVHARKERPFSPEALKLLCAYSWPGNVRELKNLVERLMILTIEADEGKPVTAADLLNHLEEGATSFRDLSAEPPADLNSKSLAQNLRDARSNFEKDYILKVLKENDFNISKTATVLGVERAHLSRKIKSFGIETKE